ncbi:MULTISPECIES: hypothetical protein [Sutcliffiella]|uniref:hypothetical protein n=1 Tax=Sutcliffiella TaxID=2837511 RepID=UPI0012EDBF51|nr:MULTISPECIES: hypothetical protein [Sutcliffiella]WBL15692.1 hypothetical protein O1A01_03315 [Sutcliffiella sp. NC1]
MIGLARMDIDHFSDEKTILLDVRGYLQAHKTPINGSYNIPLPYIKRNLPDLEGKPVCIIGSDILDVTISARFLKSKGVKVAGYYLEDKYYSKQMACTDRREIHGIH